MRLCRQSVAPCDPRAARCAPFLITFLRMEVDGCALRSAIGRVNPPIIGRIVQETGASVLRLRESLAYLQRRREKESRDEQAH
jgi:hypothetical protein